MGERIVPWLQHKQGVSGSSTFHKCCLRLHLWHNFLNSCAAFTRISWLQGQKNFSIGRELKCSQRGQLTVGLGDRRAFSVIAYSWTWDVVTPRTVRPYSCCGACTGLHSAWYSDRMSPAILYLWYKCTTPHPSSSIPYFLNYKSLQSINRITQKMCHKGEKKYSFYLFIILYFGGDIYFTKSETKNRHFILKGKL